MKKQEPRCLILKMLPKLYYGHQRGCPNGVNYERKKAVTREYRLRYHKATKKEKRALLDEFTCLTGYHRKSAVRILSDKPIKELMVHGDGKTQAGKKRPTNRTGSGFIPTRS